MKTSFQPNFREDLFKRLEQIRGKRTIAEIARHLGISHPRARNYFRGEAIPSAETLALIAEKEGVNINWLLTGKGDMLITEALKDEEIGFYQDASHVFEDAATYFRTRKPIPVVGTASANPDATIEWEALEHEVTELGPAVAIRVQDDSMEPLARKGQYGLAIPGADLRDGDLAVVKVRRKGVFFKRIFLKGKAELELQSANPVNPQPSMIVRAKDITEQYRVIGVKFE